jgi:site-specific DNA recombinase
VVVVYKVDRLTLSLADFAKMVEIFDGYGVSFVAVVDAALRRRVEGRLGLRGCEMVVGRS